MNEASYLAILSGIIVVQTAFIIFQERTLRATKKTLLELGLFMSEEVFMNLLKVRSFIKKAEDDNVTLDLETLKVAEKAMREKGDTQTLECKGYDKLKTMISVLETVKRAHEKTSKQEARRPE